MHRVQALSCDRLLQDVLPCCHTRVSSVCNNRGSKLTELQPWNCRSCALFDLRNRNVAILCRDISLSWILLSLLFFEAWNGSEFACCPPGVRLVDPEPGIPASFPHDCWNVARWNDGLLDDFLLGLDKGKKMVVENIDKVGGANGVDCHKQFEKRSHQTKVYTLLTD